MTQPSRIVFFLAKREEFGGKLELGLLFLLPSAPLGGVGSRVHPSIACFSPALAFTKEFSVK